VIVASSQLGAEALEGVDQPGAAIALDLARGPSNKLLAARGVFVELLAVGLATSLPAGQNWLRGSTCWYTSSQASPKVSSR